MICPNRSVRGFLGRLPAVLPGPPREATDLEVPFPVSAPVRIGPDLKKLGDEPLFAPDADWQSWVGEKMDRLRTGKGALMWNPGATPDLLLQWQSWIIAGLKETACAGVGPVTAEAFFPWLGAGPFVAEEFFLGLTCSLQEDFALMVADPEGRLRAELLSVFFPSGWDPCEKLGATLAQIHGPVADNDELQKSTDAMSQAMMTKGPFIRYVWTLAGSGERRRLPGHDTLGAVKTPEDLWWRCERQVTIPLQGRACLFLIRVFVTPLLRVLSEPDRPQRLMRALHSMSPELVHYKGIGRAIHILEKAFG